MSKVLCALAVSVDGYITGRDPGTGRGLGDAPMLFDWYFDGDVPSAVFGGGFKLSEPSARIFDELAGRDGAVICGHTTYDHSSHFKSGSPHPDAPLVVLSHGEVPELNERQAGVTTIEDAVAKARDIALMGELPAHAPLVRAVDDRDAHVVIFGTPTAGLPEECADLMNERPRTKVLTVERNGRSAVLYELRPVPVELGQVSPTALLDAIRGEKVAR